MLTSEEFDRCVIPATACFHRIALIQSNLMEKGNADIPMLGLQEQNTRYRRICLSKSHSEEWTVNINQNTNLTLDELVEAALKKSEKGVRMASFPLREYYPDIAVTLSNKVRIPLWQRKDIVPLLEKLLSRSVDIGDASDFYSAILDVIESDPSKIGVMMMLVVLKRELKNGGETNAFDYFAPFKFAGRSVVIVRKKLKYSDTLTINEFSELELASLFFNYGFAQSYTVQKKMSEDDIQSLLDEYKMAGTHSEPMKSRLVSSMVRLKSSGKKEIALTTAMRKRFLAWKRDLSNEEFERIEKIGARVESILGVPKACPDALLVNPDAMDEFEEKVRNLESLIKENEIEKSEITPLDKDSGNESVGNDDESGQENSEGIAKITTETDDRELKIDEQKENLRGFLECNSNFFVKDRVDIKSGAKKQQKRKKTGKVSNVAIGFPTAGNRKPMAVASKEASKPKGKGAHEVNPNAKKGSAVGIPDSDWSAVPIHAPPAFEIDKETIQRIFVDLIDDGKFAIACRFAQALEFNDCKSILHWTCLELAACSRISFESVDSSTQAFFEKVSLAERNSRNKDHESAIVFGALLRPAILQPSHIRTVIGRLNLNLYWDQIGGLVQMINSLNHKTYHPAMDYLASRSGNPSISRVDRVKQELVEWLDATSEQNAPCERSTSIIHSLTGSNGEFQSVVREIENGGADAAKLASRLIKKYETRGDIREVIKDIEKSEMMVEDLLPTSIDYLQKKVEEGCALVCQWLDAQSESGREPKGDELNNEVVTRELISTAEKTMKQLRLSSDIEDNVRVAISNWLANKVGELIDLLNGNSLRAKNSIESAVSDELDLITVEIPLQPRSLHASNEKADRKNRQDDIGIVEFLKNNSIPSPEAAIEEHSRKGAFRRAIRLLDLIEDANKRKELEQSVNENRLESIHSVEENISEVLRTLHEVSNIGTADSDDINHDIDHLNDILESLMIEKDLGVEEIAHSLSTNTPSDINMIKEHLLVLEGRIKVVLSDIRSDQRKKLETLLRERPERTDEIQNLLENLEDSKLAYVEAEIANIRSNRNIVKFNGAIASHFEKFHPEFVSGAFDNSWPNDRGFYSKKLKEIDHLKNDSNGYDEAKKILKNWFDLKEAIETNIGCASVLKKILRMLNFQNVRLNGKRETMGDDLTLYKFNLSAPSEVDWFLPPVFGSLSNSSYRILIVNGTALANQLMDHIEIGSPTIVIFTGRIPVDLRSAMAVESHKKGVPFLLIDELLMAFIAFHSENRMEVLFDCGLPFGCVKPYTTDPNKVPREMFFGRSREIKKIAGRNADGILVYGGRQMGKSALLEKVVDEHRDPKKEFLVFRHNIGMLGSYADADDIWAIIADKFQEFTSLKNKMELRDTGELGTAMKQWINENPARRILCLFDEADNFFANDLNNGFPNTNRLKSLMEETNWSFKVVFAGFHQVQRMHRLPDSPMVDLGEAVCASPLNATDEDMEAAYNLVVQPLRASGFKFKNANIPNEILSYANFCPSLIQGFMKQLTENFQIPADEGGPFWEIPRSEVFNGKGLFKFETEVRENFRYSIELDQRYKLIANALGLLKNQGMVQEVIYDGLSSDRIHAEVAGYWPRQLEPLTHAEFQNILDEMVGMGILSNATGSNSESRYCLYSYQVANMLGSKQEIEDSILSIDDYEPHLEYNPATHRRLLGKVDELRESIDADRFSPLTDYQLNQLLHSKDSIGVKFVLGIKEFGLPRVMESIRKLSKSPSLNLDNIEIEVLLPVKARDFAKAIRFEPGEKTTTLVLFEPSEDEIENILDFSENLTSIKSGRMRPILILDATRKKFRDVAIGRMPDTTILKPWGHAMLRICLEAIKAGAVQKNERNTILEKTGGIPNEVGRMIVENQMNGMQKPDDFEVSCKDSLMQLDSEILEATKLLVEITSDFRNDKGISKEELFGFCKEIMQEKLKLDLHAIGLELKMLGILDEFSPTRMHLTISAFGKLICKLVESVQDSS